MSRTISMVTAGCLIVFSFGLVARAETPRTAQQLGENAESFRLMSIDKESNLRRMFPSVDDPQMSKILADKRLLLYTDEEFPRAYQDWDGALQGVHWAHYNISADRREPHGNGNIEFPWGDPGGTHRTSNISTFRFLWLPQDKDGKTLPVVWYHKLYPGDRKMGYAWTFPVGTVVGEVLTMQGPDGKQYTFEMRVRIREYGDWDVDVFRPFPTARDLAERIKQLRPNWQGDEALITAVNHLEQPVVMTSHTLADEHPVLTFKQTMGLDTLPELRDDKLVAELLTTSKFKSAEGVIWRRGENGAETCAPTTAAGFHVVPANYDGGFISVDRFSCRRCHESVGKHVRDFQFGRDWYGRVRGSDGIFSFHPFHPGSISYNGFGRGSAAMREELIEAGYLAAYDPELHPKDVYNQVSFDADIAEETATSGSSAMQTSSSSSPGLLQRVFSGLRR